ncbi:MAG: hypothetical protein ACYCO0_01930 [Candidatus Micrarchaeaceae archaeon]
MNDKQCNCDNEGGKQCSCGSMNEGQCGCGSGGEKQCGCGNSGGGQCGCGGRGHMQHGKMREFFTSDEIIEGLKEYKKTLAKEILGIDEKIKKIEKEKK